MHTMCTVHTLYECMFETNTQPSWLHVYSAINQAFMSVIKYFEIIILYIVDLLFLFFFGP